MLLLMRKSFLLPLFQKNSDLRFAGPMATGVLPHELKISVPPPELPGAFSGFLNRRLADFDFSAVTPCTK